MHMPMLAQRLRFPDGFIVLQFFLPLCPNAGPRHVSDAEPDRPPQQRRKRKSEMQYMLMFYENDAEVAKRNDPEHAGPYWGAWNAYIGALNEAGVMIKGDGLMPPSTTTTVRLEGGNRLVQDG